MTATPSISVALATYNGAKFLPDQLDSLIAQSLRPAELIVTDDGSSDETLTILADYAARSPFPIHIHPNAQRLGYAGNFMKGAELCTSELIAFCDQDDVWLPDKLARIAAAFADPEVLLVYHNADVVDVELRRYATLYTAKREMRELDRRPIPPWHASLGFTQVFRRELLDFSDLWEQSLSHTSDDRMAHDRWFLFLATALGRVVYLDEVEALYRQHGANFCGVSRFPRMRTLIDSWKSAGQTDAAAANAARSRAHVISEVAKRASPPAQDRLARIVALYEALADRLDRRRSIYDGPSVTARARAFGRSVSQGDYGSDDQWRFGPDDITRDIAAGILRGSKVALTVDNLRRRLPT